MKIAFLATRITKYDAISNYSVDMLKKSFQIVIMLTFIHL